MNHQYFQPKVALRWVTPNGDQMLADLARVSVKGGDGKPPEKLIRYMADHSHWSPFDMVNLCIEVHAPRDISRQILRHWSIHPQEFSQRYAEVTDDMFCLREARLQHPTNRQMSVDINPYDTGHVDTSNWWYETQKAHIQRTVEDYQAALELGIAKEQARTILPEGNTVSKLYLNGTVRSWVTYLKVRQNIDATQREHVMVADEIAKVFATHFPITHKAFFPPEVMYEMVSSDSHVTVGHVADAASVRELAMSWYGIADPARIVVSFQPNLEFCRITVDHTGIGGVTWRDYRLYPVTPDTENDDDAR